MGIEQALIEEIKALTPEQQKEMLDFAAGLRQRHTSEVKTPTPGLHKGVPYWMSEDFDAPLPESFWLGEDEITA